ncbi:hypothetical protein L9F63_023396, partial [Diploptera punctata]
VHFLHILSENKNDEKELSPRVHKPCELVSYVDPPLRSIQNSLWITDQPYCLSSIYESSR